MMFSTLPWLLRILRAPVGDGDGGGSGGGGGSDGGGAGDRQDGSGGEGATGTGVTEARVQELITKALSSRLKASEEKQAKALDNATLRITETLSTTFGSKFDELAERLSPKDSKGDKPSDDITAHPKFKELQAQAARAGKLEERLQAIEDEKKALAAKERATALENAAIAAYTKHGVDPKRIPRLVVGAIARGEVAYDEDGKIVFVSDGVAEELDRGVKSWVGTDEGKLYLPPRGAGGSGDGARGAGSGKPPQGSNGSNGKGKDDTHSSAEIGQAILNQFS